MWSQAGSYDAVGNSRLQNRQPTPGPDPAVAHPDLPSQSAPQPTQANPSSTLNDSDAAHMPTIPAPGHSGPSESHQLPNAVESDTGSQPRLSATEKGKGKRTHADFSYTPMSEDEPYSDEGETPRGGVTPTPYTAAGVIFFCDRWKFCS